MKTMVADLFNVVFSHGAPRNEKNNKVANLSYFCSNSQSIYFVVLSFFVFSLRKAQGKTRKNDKITTLSYYHVFALRPPCKSTTKWWLLHFRFFAWHPAQISHHRRIIFPLSNRVYLIGSFCFNISNFKSYKIGEWFLRPIILYF
jgi:hypothetical protein